MSAPEPPLLLVDVDGVLSLFGPEVDREDCTPALVEGIPHFLSRRAAALLARLAGRFECVWCTGWEDRADWHLPQLLGLPPGWAHIAFADRPEDAAHWKLRASTPTPARTAPRPGSTTRTTSTAGPGRPNGQARRCS